MTMYTIKINSLVSTLLTVKHWWLTICSDTILTLQEVGNHLKIFFWLRTYKWQDIEVEKLQVAFSLFHKMTSNFVAGKSVIHTEQHIQSFHVQVNPS